MSDEQRLVTGAGLPPASEFLKNVAGHFLNSCRKQCLAHFGHDETAKGIINAATSGLGSVVNTAIDESPRIPKESLSAVDVARHLGLLPGPRPRAKGRK